MMTFNEFIQWQFKEDGFMRPKEWLYAEYKRYVDAYFEEKQE